MKIIDISKHNGIIDFDKVKASGKVDGVMIRSSWGHFREDEQFKRNVSECERLNIPYGFYHYSYACNYSEMVEEAKEFINLIKDYKPLLPVAIDMEDADGYKAKMGTLNNITLNTEICRYTCAELEKAGFYAMVYANLDWTKTKLNMSMLSSYDLWLARWNANAPSRKCGMWQYTNSASVNGIAGRVDMSKAYIDYPSLIKEHGLNGWKESEIPEEEENEFEKEWGHYVECVKPLQILWSDDTNYMLGFGADDKDSSFIANKKYFSKVI